MVLHEPHLGTAALTSQLSSFEGDWTTTREAEHWFTEVAAGLDQIQLACTHFVPGKPVVLVTAQTGRLEPIEGGRAFLFPGSQGLSGAVEVGDVLDGTAIDQVVALGGTTVARRAVLETQGFVRPTFVGGSLVLHVRPGADGVLMPFEQPDPTACCADHG